MQTLEQLIRLPNGEPRQWRSQSDACKALRRAHLPAPKGDGYEVRRVGKLAYQIILTEDRAPTAVSEPLPPAEDVSEDAEAVAQPPAPETPPESMPPGDRPGDEHPEAVEPAVPRKGKRGKYIELDVEPPAQAAAEPAEPTFFVRLEQPKDNKVKVIAEKLASPFVVEIVGHEDGKVHHSIDTRVEAAPAARPRKQAGGGGRRSGITRATDPARAEFNEKIVGWALREQGVKRTEMSKLNGGVVLNWKQILQQLGKSRGLTVKVDKSGETPVYWLVKGKP